jgi:hypothetical protein
MALHWRWMAVSSKPPYDVEMLNSFTDHLFIYLHTSTRATLSSINCE